MARNRRPMDIEAGRQAGANAEEGIDSRCSYWRRCVDPKSSGTISCCQWTFGIVFLVSTILILVLVPLHFSYVEYDQWAFNKNTLDNNVDTSNVYDLGRYPWGVSHAPLAFSRQYQPMSLSLAVFPTNGLEFDIEVHLFWRYQKNNLGKFYRAFGTTGSNQIENRVNSEIKSDAPQYTLEQFITDRERINTELHTSVVNTLSSIWVDVPLDKFYLGRIGIPDEIKTRDLDTAVQAQRNLQEENIQTAALIRAETERQRQGILSNITRIQAQANAFDISIKQQAVAQGERLVLSADGLGLENLFLQMNITASTTKQDYIEYFSKLDEFDISFATFVSS